MGNQPSREFTLSHQKAEPALNRHPELKTVPDYIRYHAEIRPDTEAFVFVSTDKSRETVTWKQFYGNCQNVGKSLLALGVKKSEFVAVSLRNCPQWLFITFGAMFAGARPVCLSFTYSDGSDVVKLLTKIATCSCIVCDSGIDGGNLKILKSLLDDVTNGHAHSSKIPSLRYVVSHNDLAATIDAIRLDDIISQDNGEVQLPVVDAEEIAGLFQTSGSTGLPKAIAHTHASFIAASSHHFAPPYSEHHILFNDRPFMWLGGFPVNVIVGDKRVTLSGYGPEPEDKLQFYYDVIRQEKVTTVFALVPFLHFLMSKQDNIPDDWPLEIALTGGQPIRKEFAECLGKLCKYFVCLYGASEFLLGICILATHVDEYSNFSCGYPFRGMEVKIVDDNMATVPVGTSGELLIRTTGLFKEYYNDPERTRAALTDDGWFRSDDMGYMSSTGEFFVEGRKSDMIVSGGMNVAPSILDIVIRSCPGVANSCCVPIPHDILHQVICACVIIQPGSDVTEEKLRIFCETTHNDSPRIFTAVPEYYLFVDRFPETMTGKTSRKALTELAVEKVMAGKTK